MRKRIEKIVLLALIAANIVGVHLYITFYSPASQTPAPQVVNIQRGSSFRVIANNLEDAGIIRSADSFIFAASLVGAYRSVKAGEYELDGTMSPIEILRTLVKGVVKKYMVTIPEGYSAREVAGVLSAAGLVDSEAFMERAMDRELARSLGVSGPTLEGYLFPDTYEFTQGLGADEIIARMVERFKSVYFPEIDEAAKKRKMGMRDVVTLASIIEKETASNGERRRISAVFHNRLRKGIRLQSDPTVIYGIENFDGNLTRKHLRTKNPYNTYRNYGLPPGPIANPGKASLEAAVDPENVPYLYFVSRNNGTHYFSRTLREHNAAVLKYQKMRTVAQ
ncbi:MAG: endolytic transglycosylase MltG [Thermodesulfobacteriota bacterium]